MNKHGAVLNAAELKFELYCPEEEEDNHNKEQDLKIHEEALTGESSGEEQHMLSYAVQLERERILRI